MKMRLAFGFLLAVSCLAAKAESLQLRTNSALGELEIRYKNQKLLVYAFATNQFKAYVRELYTLRGENVLRDAPADHLHHHGLMYAVHVNGVNFWEEKVEPGVQRPIKFLGRPSGGQSPEGMPQAFFSQEIHWLAPSHTAAANAKDAVLIEHRHLRIAVTETNDEVALYWLSSFRPGSGAGHAKLHGTAYNGLGLRLPDSFDHVAQFQNSTGTLRVGTNASNVSQARWTSVSGEISGHEVMLALLGHPVNPRGDAKFFSMLEPFTYLSATQGLDQEPIECPPGGPFALSYLLLVYSTNQPAPFIEQRYQDWIKRTRRTPTVFE